MEFNKISEICSSINENISKVIVGKENIIKYVLTAILSEGHLLLEDTPGTGKTVMAKSLAKSLGGKFKRIQFTPDLLPSDITGLNVYNVKTSEFNFMEGPAFTNILLADEINRATPRTQSSLLEVMEEKQITTDGQTRILDKPFIVIATENPIENSGTFPLPEAQLDRFIMKLSMGYPNLDEEISIMNRFISDNPLESISEVCSKEEIIEMQKLIKEVYVHKDILKYIADIIQATRNDDSIDLGVSPRGTLALLKCCQSFAAINNRKYVVPDDVKNLVPYVLGHRIIPNNSINSMEGNNKIIKNIVDNIPVPTEKWDK